MSQKNYNLLIIQELLKEDQHIRGLAKRLKTNAMTISRKLEELQKNNAVDFKKKGKNKTYGLKKTVEAQQYIYMAENERTLELVKEQPVIRRIIKTIREDPKIGMTLLFGSYAKGTQTKKSDIDIYTETKDKKIKQKIEDIDTRINTKIGLFNPKNLLIKEIQKNHVILKRVERYYELSQKTD